MKLIPHILAVLFGAAMLHPARADDFAARCAVRAARVTFELSTDGGANWTRSATARGSAPPRTGNTRASPCPLAANSAPAARRAATATDSRRFLRVMVNAAP